MYYKLLPAAEPQILNQVVLCCFEVANQIFRLLMSPPPPFYDFQNITTFDSNVTYPSDFWMSALRRAELTLVKLVAPRLSTRWGTVWAITTSASSPLRTRTTLRRASDRISSHTCKSLTSHHPNDEVQNKLPQFLTGLSWTKTWPAFWQQRLKARMATHLKSVTGKPLRSSTALSRFYFFLTLLAGNGASRLFHVRSGSQDTL